MPALKVQINFILAQCFLYKPKLLLPALFSQCGCQKNRWKGLPGIKQHSFVLVSVLPEPGPADLIRFGEYQGERDPVAAKEAKELPVGFLHLQTCIDQEKQADQVFSFQYIIPDHLHHLLPLGTGHSGITVPWQVNQVPFVIDQEMIDQLGFPRGRGCFCQLVPVGKHIDKG